MSHLTTDPRATARGQWAGASSRRARRLRLGGALLAAALAVVVLHGLLVYASGSAQGAVAEQDSSTVAVLPAVASVNEGELVTVSVWLSDAVDYYGFDVRLSFDPAIVSATAIVPRWDLFDEQNHIIVKDEWENDAGTMWYAISNQNPAEAFTGTGEVCALVFQATEMGTSPLTITYAKGSTRDGEPITPTRQGGSIEVGRVESTLTPSYVVQNTPYAIQTYTLELANQGTSADTFHLTHAMTDTSELSGEGLEYNWGVLSSTHILEVAAGVTETVAITVQVPRLETTWVTHTLYLTATSTSYPDQQVTSTLKTHTGGVWDAELDCWVGCRFDLGYSGMVNIYDMREVLSASGTPNLWLDFGHSGMVNIYDVRIILERSGTSCAK